MAVRAGCSSRCAPCRSFSIWCATWRSFARSALFINFSNPENRIILALANTAASELGLCEGIFGGRNYVARIMELPSEQVEVWGAGINHFQCLLQIRNRSTGEDLYPLLRKKEKTTTLPLRRSPANCFARSDFG